MTIQNKRKRLSEEQLRKLEGKLKSKDIQCKISANKKTEEILSYGQERLWFLNQMEPGKAVYNIPKVLKIRGKLNIEALKKSFITILERHETLRTTFHIKDNQVIQKVNEVEYFDIPVIHPEGKTNQERDKLVKGTISEEIHRPFDLEKGPLYRLSLYEISDTEYYFVILLHHIISDGWSHQILFKELSTLYKENIQEDYNHSLPDLPIQYTDFSLWQKKELKGNEKYKKSLDYWMNKLKGANEVLDLPKDFPRPKNSTYTGDVYTANISSQLVDKLHAFNVKHKSSMFMTLLSIFKILLFRYTGQNDLVVGTPNAGRNRDEIQNLIGFFVNNLSLRTEVREDMNFLEMLNDVRNGILDAFEHEEVPFDAIVEELKPNRQMNHHPIFQVYFSYQKDYWENVELFDLEVQPVDIKLEVSRVDFSLHVDESKEGINLHIEYSSELYKRETIQQLIRHFINLINELMDNPNQFISDVSLLTQEELDLLLKGPNQHYLEDINTIQSIHRRFEQQVINHPNEIAIQYKDEQITYKELNNQSNQLARYLIKQGVKPENPVGICLERSTNLIISILAVLKAGGAYVPIDPNVPSERIKFILDDSSVQLIITNHNVKNTVLFPNKKVVNLQENQALIKKESIENLELQLDPSNLAYVIYTSGSTGTPKGVLVEHTNVIRLFSSTDKLFEFDHTDVWTMYHSYAFDFSVWEIWGALFFGGKLLIVPNFVCKSAESFYNLLKEEKITVLNQTPSAFQQLTNHIDDMKSEDLGLKLRYVIFGGEQLNFNILSPWYEKLGERCPEMINMYGITETTVHATFKRVTERDLKAQATTEGSNIGNPLPDLSLFVLDNNLQAVPIGVTGELFIGGPGVVRGYHNRPDLNKERFINHPFGHGSKLYRSGDLARILPNNEIEYRGRIDDQVKIRGFRIELGEIQSVILKHPMIKDAAVIVRNNLHGEPQIVSYVVPKENIDGLNIQNYLKQFLPSYMIPAFVTKVKSIPKTSNAKLDKKVLLEIPLENNTLYESKDLPKTEAQKKLSVIFKKFLGLNEIYIKQSFFDLGGHSLMATRVVSVINSTFNVRISIRDFFENDTIESLGKVICNLKEDKDKENIPTIKVHPNNENIPLSFSQSRLYFIEKLREDNNAYKIPLTLKLKGYLNLESLEYSLNKIVERHNILRTNFHEYEGKPIQVVRPFNYQPLKVYNWIQYERSELQEQIHNKLREEWERVFDLENDDLFIYYIIQASEDEFYLFTNTHHIITDGWSIQILIKELMENYVAIETGMDLPISSQPIQYTDFTVWQREFFETSIMEKQLTYWKEKLSGKLPILQLPSDQKTNTVEEFTCKRIKYTLSEALTKKLKGLNKKYESTMFMLATSVFKVLLARLSGQNDIIVGTPIANRNRKEIEDLLGLFVNTVALRTNLSDRLTFSELLKQFKETCIEVFDNQDIPFEQIVKEVQPDRNLKYNPIFDVLVNFHNAAEEGINRQVHNLAIEEVNLEISKSKYPITFHIFNDKRLHVEFVYRPDMYSPERMQEMLYQFEYLLEQIVRDPEKEITSYSLVTPKTKSLPKPDLPLNIKESPSVLQLIDEWADKVPHKTAITQNNIDWTYQELVEHANNIAKVLVTKGLSKGEVVTLIGERSFGLYASMLGILKSGGVLQTIDANHMPIERQQLMIDTVNPTFMISVNQQNEGIKSQFQQVIDVDSIEGYPTSISDEVSLPHIFGEDSAYIYFTSGSTGKPKAVLGRHQGLNHVLNWLRYEFSNIDTTDRCAQLINLSFDVSLRDIFLPLICGATLCLPEDVLDLSADKVVSWLRRDNISVVHTVPSLANHWLTTAKEMEGKIQLKYTFLAGEPLSDTLITQWRLHFEGEIVNAYGPTETTMAVAFSKVPKVTDNGTQSPGKSIEGTQIIILNEHSNLCGIGEIGDIAIRSPYRTLGYLNNIEETNRLFIPNPFNSSNPNDLIYITGDVGRYRMDGSLEIIGRKDNQVKINGVRIELEEIQASLLKHEAISSCAVIDIKKGEDISIAAYIVSNQEITINDLRQYLANIFPKVMIPRYFIFLDRLPLLPNGKVDRKHLRTMDPKINESSEENTPATDPVEKELVTIWEEILDTKNIKINQDFFELGGHSILAMEIMYKIRKSFKVDLPLRTFIQTPTIKEIASHIRNYSSIEKGQCLIPLQSESQIEDEVPLFIIHPIGGGVLCYSDFVKKLKYKGSVYGLQSYGYDSDDKALEDVKEMANKYLEEIRKKQPKGPYRLIAWSFGVTILYEIVRVLEEEGQNIEYLAFLDYLPEEKVTKELAIKYVTELILNNMNIDLSTIESMSPIEGLEFAKSKVKTFISPEKGETFEGVDRAVKVMVGNCIARQSFKMKDKLNTNLHLYYVNEIAPVSPLPLLDPKSAQKVTNGNVIAHRVNGHHHNMCSSEHADTLAETINQHLDQVCNKNFERSV
ncbi:non-ribosomal peptide synthetase [Bacillus cereus group sp. TH152-1LC]|uniref:non-ribosomal peptide synthetase n=1 Tax=Bacillus cereus group sp. TH152-1LC TaxID=3018060 RepID=UPI0022E39175|nr:non-ribosomal peptide synthetase [Bacillus cereus group sp. TH152-1LC]MDA1677504.1 amino acid adenylation domain-containing protein [Bacillus cereus group sp. TH152-1LC]